MKRIVLVFSIYLYLLILPLYCLNPSANIKMDYLSETNSYLIDGSTIYTMSVNYNVQFDNQELKFVKKELSGAETTYLIVSNLSMSIFDSVIYPIKKCIMKKKGQLIHVAVSLNTHNEELKNYYFRYDTITGEIVHSFSQFNSNDDFWAILDEDGSQKLVTVNNENIPVDSYSLIQDYNVSHLSDSLSEFSLKRFNGKDHYEGKVHFNSDIWIEYTSDYDPQNPANPLAPGWPLFDKKVSTTGQIKIYPSGNSVSTLPQVNMIFQEGYVENTESLHLDHEQLKAESISPFGMQYDPNKIYILNIDGTTVNIKILNISPTNIDMFTVFSRYPDALHPVIPGQEDTFIGDSLWTNYVSLPDTLWEGGSSSYAVMNTSYYFNGDIWIKGNLAGRLGIITAGNAYIIGNITYANTLPGDFPDNPDLPNPYDYLSLISEKSIFIKYKHFEKEGGDYTLYNDNSQGPNGHVWLYGNYSALGLNDNEGVFSFEYQHPYGSTPSFYGFNNKTGRDTMYTFIDLHRYMFPAPAYNPSNPFWMNFPYDDSTPINQGYPYSSSDNYPWYGNVDYPWYNPVWPETANQIVYERGTLHLYGTLTQKYNGLLHRTGASSDPDMGRWSEGKFGPGHHPTGYKTHFHHIDYESMSDEYSFRTPLWSYYISRLKMYDSEVQLPLQSDTLLYNTHTKIHNPAYSNDSLLVILTESFNEQNVNKISVNSNHIQSETIDSLYSTENYSITYLAINPVCFLYQEQYTSEQYFYKIQFLNTHHIISATNNSNSLLSLYYDQDTNKNYLIEYHNTLRIFEIANESLNLIREYSVPDNEYLHMTIRNNQGNHPYLVLFKYFDGDDTYQIQHLYQISLIPDANEDITVGEGSWSVKHFPNPFNPDLHIQLNLPKKNRVKINLYNIRGQKVRTLINEEFDAGKHEFVWNGKNDHGLSLSSGVYFYKISSGENQKIYKVILLK